MPKGIPKNGINRGWFKKGIHPKTEFQKGHHNKHSLKTKEKIGMASKGRKHTKISRRKMSEKMKGKRCSPKTEFKKGVASWNKGIKCPQFSGKNHYNWKGGITPENQRIRHSLETRLWRESVFERDKYTCQKCDQWGGYLETHHIRDFAEVTELRTSIENGITFCKKCHKLFHKIYGIKNNTKEQVEEFLSNSPHQN